MSQRKALLIDITLCIGCNACQTACKESHNMPLDEESKTSTTAYTALDEYDGVYVRRMCQHCEDPTCMSVCPVGAFHKSAEGAVVYDADKCIGCRYCIQACPFQVPRYEWSSTFPRVQKCDMCHERTAQGLPTMCAEVCPTGATKFGNRDELLKEAYERINAEPDKYVHKVYGETEVGGTSVLYLTSVPFENIGFKTTLQQSSLPQLTWNALSKIPGIVTVGGVMLYGIWWITNRREEVKEYEQSMHGMDKTNHGNQ
ncbi:MAG: 4Fe-4S dicluster domain-containing protein [Bacteroidota bacterium]